MKNLDKIEKCFRMLASSNDGEILNAVSAIKKILHAENKNICDLSNRIFKEQYKNYAQQSYSQPYQPYKNAEMDEDHKDMIEQLIAMDSTCTQWETTFITDIKERNRPLSEKQIACLLKIYNKYFG
jgi:hypothetical protein